MYSLIEKKAFDTIGHCLFQQKLYHYCIRGIIKDWCHLYLTDRVQSTQIGSETSTKVTTACGVPQGSLQGLWLFLLNVNDLCMSSDKLSFSSFADDTNLFMVREILIPLIQRVSNAKLSKVQDWLVANKPTLNAKKSNFVIFHPWSWRYPQDIWNYKKKEWLKNKMRHYLLPN